jgi:hypothetical protein
MAVDGERSIHVLAHARYAATTPAFSVLEGRLGRLVEAGLDDGSSLPRYDHSTFAANAIASSRVRGLKRGLGAAPATR